MPTDWRPSDGKPAETEGTVRVRFRNGEISKHTYRPDQLNWRDRKWDFDVMDWREE